MTLSGYDKYNNFKSTGVIKIRDQSYLILFYGWLICANGEILCLDSQLWCNNCTPALVAAILLILKYISLRF